MAPLFFSPYYTVGDSVKATVLFAKLPIDIVGE
jgi:hypothetical protein